MKAFRLYGAQGEEDKVADGQEERDSNIDSGSEDENELEVEYQDVSTILDGDTGLEYQLPKHQRCACHLLNLVSTVDTTAAGTTSETYKNLFWAAFAKCNALWNKTSRSTTAAEIVERECQLQFLQPNQTHWSSLFFTVERVVHIQKEQGETAIHNVCMALKIKMEVGRTRIFC